MEIIQSAPKGLKAMAKEHKTMVRMYLHLSQWASPGAGGGASRTVHLQILDLSQAALVITHLKFT